MAMAGDCDWSPLGTGGGPAAYGCAALDNGSVVFGGSLSGIDGQFVNRIAIWDGSTWSEPGNGVNGFVGLLQLSQAGDSSPVVSSPKQVASTPDSSLVGTEHSGMLSVTGSMRDHVVRY